MKNTLLVSLLSIFALFPFGMIGSAGANTGSRNSSQAQIVAKEAAALQSLKHGLDLQISQLIRPATKNAVQAVSVAKPAKPNLID